MQPLPLASRPRAGTASFQSPDATLRVDGWICGPLATNAYLLQDLARKKMLLIDPAIQSEDALTHALDLQAQGFEMEAIWNTHGHFDHVYSNADWKARFSVPLWLHSSDAFFLDHLREQSLWFGLPAPEEVAPDHDWNGLAHAAFAGRKVQVLHLPGHSPGSVAFHFAEEEMLIVGDVLFQGSVGRTDLPGSSPQELQRSLQVLAALPKQTLVLAGHGEPTTIGEELASNPFLRGL